MKIPLLRARSILTEKLALNDYILFIFLSLMFTASCISIIGNILTDFPMVANLKWLFSILFCLVGYYLLYRQVFLETFKILMFGGILFLILLPSWFYGGGDNTITLLYLMLISIEVFLIFKNSVVKCIFTFLNINAGIVLLTITYEFPHLIQGDQGQNVYADSLIQIIIIFAITTISIAIYTSRYREQHKLLTLMNARLEQLSIIDDLSGVFNKRKIIDILENICREGKLTDSAVVMVDIDSFKNINDTYGHVVGDRAIRHVADHLMNIVGNDGQVGRFGGDEFLLILYRLSYREMEIFSEKILKIPTFEKLELTMSVGISRRTGSENPDTLINLADRNLLMAKRVGKNNVYWQ